MLNGTPHKDEQDDKCGIFQGVYYISYFYRCVDYNQQETAKWKEVAPKAKDWICEWNG